MTNTVLDIETMTKLKVGERQAQIVQDFQSLACVVSQALGGSTEKATKTEDPNILRPQTEAEFHAAFNAVFGGNG